MTGKYVKDTDLNNIEKINFKQLIASQLNAIQKISRQEYYGGFWHKTGTFQVGSNLQYIEAYVEDTREQYSNAVECLHDVMEPKFDDEMTTQSESLNGEIDAINDTWDKSSKEEADKMTLRNKRRLIMRKIFRALNKFLGRKNYFDNFEDFQE